MDDPQTDVRRVVSELCEPQDAAEMVAAVEKYFTEDAVCVSARVASSGCRLVRRS